MNAKRLQKHLPFLLAALLTAWAIGQIFRDEEWITALVFYIPSPVLGGLFLLAALISAFRRNFRHTIGFIVLSLAPLIVTICIENHFRPVRENPTPELKIVHWNVARGQLGIGGVLREIENLNADFYFLSEAPHSFDSLNGLHSLRLGTMLVLSELPVELEEDVSEGGVRKCLIKCGLPQQKMRVMFADVPSSIFFHRHPALMNMVDDLAQMKPDLLLGDFNAPRRSLAIDQLPSEYSHAYRSAGSGWSYTWPSFCPCLAIDHCIHSNSIIPTSYRLVSTICSDHRIQIFEFRLSP